MKLHYEHYYTYDELTQALESLVQDYPRLAKMYSIGCSPEGRELWMVEITDKSTGEADSKPAYYIDGNHHAGEVTGSMVALYTIDELLSRSEEEEFKILLQRFSFYILPRVSPDGAEIYLTSAAQLRSVPRAYPFVEEMPGLVPDDIDGDGKILLMRVPSPLGAWKADPTDGRRMLRRSPDEDNGTFYAVYQEGLVHEYDGFAFDQAPPRWGLDLNRNYPIEWGIESRQPGAGIYPLSEPETKAVADFVLAHPNIGGAATLHTTGGVILRPPGTKPEKKSNPHDIKILKAIGEMAAQETGYPSVNVYDEFLSDAANFSSGAFDDWLYATQGIPAYTVELWDLGLRSGVHMWPRKDKEEPELAEDYAKVLAWIDQENGGRGFIDWHHFQHPQLGEVEIGGFDTKFIVQNAPPELLEQECQKNASFFYRHARTLPRLSLEILEVKKLDTNTWRLSVQVSNLGYLPTYLTQQAKDIRVIPPATVELCGAAVLDGTARREIPQLEGRSAVSGSFQAGGYRGGPVARQKAQFSWIIKGEADTEVCVKVASRKAGNPQVHLKLSEQ